MAYTFRNKCAKNLCKRIVLLQLIIENVVTFFFGTQCRYINLRTKGGFQVNVPAFLKQQEVKVI